MANSRGRQAGGQKTRPVSSGQRPVSSGRGSGSAGAAAARARIAAAERRRRMMLVLGSVGAVIVLVVVLVVVKVSMGSDAPKSGKKAVHATQSIDSEINSVPAATLDSIKAGSSQTPFKPLSGAALTSGGKPEVLYIGAEWCPYCAATRWSLAVALGRFGTLAGLGQTASSPSDVYANTPTLTFHGATYTSSTLTFVGKEVQSNQVSGGKYETLDSLTAAEAKIYQDGGGGFPFIDIGGKYQLSSAPYLPTVLAGKTHQQIAAALSDPSSPIAQAVDGGANAITAAICKATNGQPGSVCSSAAVTGTPVQTSG